MSKNNVQNKKRSEPKPLSPELQEWLQGSEDVWLDAWQVDPAQYGLTTLVVWSTRLLIDNLYTRKTVENKRWEAFWLGWSPSCGLVHQLKAYSRVEDAKPQPNFWWTSDIQYHIRLSQEEKWGVPTVTLSVDSKDFEKKSRVGNLFVKLAAQQKVKFFQAIPEQASQAFKACSEISNRDDSWVYFDRLQTILGENPEGGLTIAEAIKRRTQFIYTHPILGTDYLFHRGEEISPVDSGERSLPLLAKVYEISERTVRFLGGLEKVAQSSARYHVIANISFWDAALGMVTNEGLKELSAMPATGWSFLNQLFELPAFKRAPGLAKNLRLEPGIAGNNIIDFAKTRAITHLTDTAQNFALEILFPYLVIALPELDRNRSYTQYTTLVNFAEEAIFSMGLKKAINILSEHMRNEVHHARMGAREVDEKEWGELAQPVQAPNGLTMRFLSSQRELNWEGVQMQHCVASYGKSCALGLCAIMSIGQWVENEWQPIATVEIRSKRNGAKVPVLYSNQHYGPHNNIAPAASQTALDWWLKQVASGALSVQKKQLVVDAGNISYEITGANLANHLGNGWNEPEAFAYRWDRWRRLLGTNAKSEQE